MSMQKRPSAKPVRRKELPAEPADSLESRLPEGLVVNRVWLKAQGFARPRIDYYLRAGRLEAVAHGIYRRAGPPLKWEHLVYSLQVLGYPVHVGGRSALEQLGFAHFLPLAGVQHIDLYTARSLPNWFSTIAAPVRFELHLLRFFTELPPGAITTRPFGHWDWPLRYATPELALLELLSEVKHEADFSLADKFFESATTLRPRMVSTLLRHCTQVKAKRLFLWFATRHAHAWQKRLDLSGVELGRGKRVIVRGGALDTKHQITVPREMMSGAGQRFF
jgi:Transcriptional regulator, AbiEi antitoxin, Type IV TA system/Transcriptional regulator, AbiEi antitoxin N-terminal domain